MKYADKMRKRASRSGAGKIKKFMVKIKEAREIGSQLRMIKRKIKEYADSGAAYINLKWHSIHKQNIDWLNANGFVLTYESGWIIVSW